MRAIKSLSLILLLLPFSIWAQLINSAGTTNQRFKKVSGNYNINEDTSSIKRLSDQIIPLNVYTVSGEIIRDRNLNDDAHIKNNPGELFSLYSVSPGETGFGNLLMADCDRNGENELIYERNGILYFIEISEMNYRIVHTLNGYYNPIAIGYIDNDDRIDLVVQEGNMVKVIEGISDFDFPTELVWQHTLDGTYGTGNVQQFGSITDIDRDGCKEITITSNQFTQLDYGAVSVFEFNSDNNYVRTVYISLNYEGSGLGSLAIGDINNNNTIEIAVAAGINDTLYIYECVADNSVKVRSKIFTDLVNQYSVVLGNDLDGDGVPEVCVSGDDFNPSGMRSVKVYELENRDNSNPHALIKQYTGRNGIQPISSGNILASGRDELVLQSSGKTFIFNANHNNFDLTGVLEEEGGSFAYCLDVKRGLGDDELQIMWPGGVYTYTSSDYKPHLEKEFTSITNLLNYPNPFNPTTNIQYSIGSLPDGKAGTQFVSLIVYNVLGKEIATLVNEEKSAGNYEVNFNASELPSGIYIYKLSAGTFTQTEKMILIK